MYSVKIFPIGLSSIELETMMNKFLEDKPDETIQKFVMPQESTCNWSAMIVIKTRCRLPVKYSQEEEGM